MSTQVELSALATVAARFRFAYLLTANGDGSPHALAVTAVVDGDTLTVRNIGRRTRDNLLAHPDVTLLWPPESLDEYSLIVDGCAVVSQESARVTPTRAVLHRPRPRPGSAAGSCGSDCVELPMPPCAADNEV